jgi:Brp/Blh family beta-carotene 15,15'-monooxygenase
MNLQKQGLLFCWLSGAALMAIPWMPHLSTEVQLLLLSPIILLIGVPHGALDVVFARQFVGVRSIQGWLFFALAYAASAALVFGFWWVAPGLFLAAFLLVSVFHFSGDPEGEVPRLFRTLYGGSVILCPLLLHESEVLEVFSYLAGDPNAQMIVSLLKWAAWPWALAIGLVALAGAKRDPVRCIELVSVAALLTLAPPLLGFTLFFCGMHGARHILRTRDYSREGTLQSLMLVAFWPMVITLICVALALWLSKENPLGMQLTQLLFVGLAALTVPHMIVIEQVRWTNWMAGRNFPTSGLQDKAKDQDQQAL